MKPILQTVVSSILAAGLLTGPAVFFSTAAEEATAITPLSASSVINFSSYYASAKSGTGVERNKTLEALDVALIFAATDERGGSGTPYSEPFSLQFEATASTYLSNHISRPINVFGANKIALTVVQTANDFKARGILPLGYVRVYGSAFIEPATVIVQPGSGANYAWWPFEEIADEDYDQAGTKYFNVNGMRNVVFVATMDTDGIIRVDGNAVRE